MDEMLPLCDVRGCTSEMFVRIDGISHCYLHFSDMWDRWQVARDSWIREHWDGIVYRQSPQAEALAGEMAWQEYLAPSAPRGNIRGAKTTPAKGGE